MISRSRVSYNYYNEYNENKWVFDICNGLKRTGKTQSMKNKLRRQRAHKSYKLHHN